MKNLPRYHSKKDWRTHIDKCWTVQENLQKCVVNSEEFPSLALKAREVVSKSISKGFIYDYINFYMTGSNMFSVEAKFFYDKESPLWKSHGQNLTPLDQRCNLFSLYECVEQTYNLENLEGSYEFAKRFFN